MWVDLICDEWTDEQAAEMAACLGDVEAAGLLALLREDSGTRRLLPLGVRDALLAERGAMQAAHDALRAPGEVGRMSKDDACMVRHREMWESDGTAILRAADGAAFEARERWGHFLLAVGVAVGLAWRDGERGAVALTNAVGVAADWCDDRGELADLMHGASR